MCCHPICVAPPVLRPWTRHFSPTPFSFPPAFSPTRFFMDVYVHHRSPSKLPISFTAVTHARAAGTKGGHHAVRHAPGDAKEGQATPSATRGHGGRAEVLRMGCPASKNAVSAVDTVPAKRRCRANLKLDISISTDSSPSSSPGTAPAPPRISCGFIATRASVAATPGRRPYVIATQTRCF